MITDDLQISQIKKVQIVAKLKGRLMHKNHGHLTIVMLKLLFQLNILILNPPLFGISDIGILFWCKKSKLKGLVTKRNNISIELINTSVVPIRVLAWYWKLRNIPENNEVMNDDTPIEFGKHNF